MTPRGVHARPGIADEPGMNIDSALASASLSSEVAVRVAKKSRDVATQQGEAAVALLQAAAATQELAQANSSAPPGRLDVFA